MKKITHVGSSACPPCVVSRLAFERLQQLNPDTFSYEYISVDPYKINRKGHREAIKELYVENGIDQPTITVRLLDDYSEPQEHEEDTFIIPQFFDGDRKFLGTTGWQNVFNKIVNDNNLVVE